MDNTRLEIEHVYRSDDEQERKRSLQAAVEEYLRLRRQREGEHPPQGRE